MADATFGAKLKQMRKDLASIVDRMNRDRSYDAAQAAQTALTSVAATEDQLEQSFGDLDDFKWDWQPKEDG